MSVHPDCVGSELMTHFHWQAPCVQGSPLGGQLQAVAAEVPQGSVVLGVPLGGGQVHPGQQPLPMLVQAGGLGHTDQKIQEQLPPRQGAEVVGVGGVTTG